MNIAPVGHSFTQMPQELHLMAPVRLCEKNIAIIGTKPTQLKHPVAIFLIDPTIPFFCFLIVSTGQIGNALTAFDYRQ
jgi:hypothetical protein